MSKQTKGDEAMTGKQAAQEIRQLSSGTIGNLTGCRSYQEIDQRREDIAVVIEASVKHFNRWQDAWNWVEQMNNADLPVRSYMD